MKRALIIAGLLLACESTLAAANTFVVRVGQSNDAWERPEVERSACRPVSDELVSVMGVEGAQGAINRLEANAFLQISDNEAFELVGEPPAGSFARYRLDNAISTFAEHRRTAYEHRRGSWSLADEGHLNGLRSLRDGLLEQPLVPFLVRGLAADKDGVDRFEASVCNGQLITISFPTRGTGSAGLPDRVPLIVLLAAPPSDVIPQWTFDDPELNQ